MSPSESAPMAARPSLFVILLLTSGVLGCNSQPVVSTFSPALFDKLGRPSLGYLEHRGTMYDLRDAAHPVFREGGRDQFAFEFSRYIADSPGSGTIVIIEHFRWQTGSTNTMALDSSNQSMESGPPLFEMGTQFEEFIIPPEQLPNPVAEPTQSFDREP